jgi:hypothetical protein
LIAIKFLCAQFSFARARPKAQGKNNNNDSLLFKVFQIFEIFLLRYVWLSLYSFQFLFHFILFSLSDQLFSHSFLFYYPIRSKQCFCRGNNYIFYLKSGQTNTGLPFRNCTSFSPGCDRLCGFFLTSSNFWNKFWIALTYDLTIFSNLIFTIFNFLEMERFQKPSLCLKDLLLCFWYASIILCFDCSVLR